MNRQLDLAKPLEQLVQDLMMNTIAAQAVVDKNYKQNMATLAENPSFQKLMPSFQAAIMPSRPHFAKHTIDAKLILEMTQDTAVSAGIGILGFPLFHLYERRYQNQVHQSHQIQIEVTSTLKTDEEDSDHG